MKPDRLYLVTYTPKGYGTETVTVTATTPSKAISLVREWHRSDYGPDAAKLTCRARLARDDDRADSLDGFF